MTSTADLPSPVNDNYMSVDDSASENSFVIDRLHVMLHQEIASYPSCVNYTAHVDMLPVSCPLTQKAVVNDEWRRKICEWAFGVVDHFEYSREAVSLAMNYLDRYASFAHSKGMPLSRKAFQLAAVASLYLAIKIEGKNNRGQRLTIATLVELSRGLFSVKLIEQMEREILTALRWKINPPTVVQCISHLVELFPTQCAHSDFSRARHGILEMSRFFSELSVYQASLSIEQRPSVVAFSCVLNAMECVSTVSLPYSVRQDFLEDIAKATHLQEGMMEVCKARSHLRELHSTIPENQFDTSADGGSYDRNMSSLDRLSPVSVTGL